MKRVSSNESNKSTESLIPLIKSQDKESWVSQNGKCSNNNSMINSNSFTVVLDNHVSKRKQPFKMLPMTQICLLLCVLFAIILTGVVIDHCFQIMKLRNNYDHILNEQVKTSEIIQYLKAIQSKNEGDITSSKYNETTQELSTKEPIEEDQSKLTNSLPLE
jgi:beta-lactamase regulating signal transducer with metallopeptidase domain